MHIRKTYNNKMLHNNKKKSRNRSMFVQPFKFVFVPFDVCSWFSNIIISFKYSMLARLNRGLERWKQKNALTKMYIAMRSKHENAGNGSHTIKKNDLKISTTKLQQFVSLFKQAVQNITK